MSSAAPNPIKRLAQTLSQFVPGSSDQVRTDRHTHSLNQYITLLSVYKQLLFNHLISPASNRGIKTKQSNLQLIQSMNRFLNNHFPFFNMIYLISCVYSCCACLFLGHLSWRTISSFRIFVHIFTCLLSYLFMFFLCLSVSFFSLVTLVFRTMPVVLLVLPLVLNTLQ